MRIVAFAEIDADARLVAVDAAAEIFWRGDVIPGQLFTAKRGNRVAVAVEVEDVPEIDMAFRARNLAARAVVETVNGLDVVTSVDIVRPGHCLAFAADGGLFALDGDARTWAAAIRVATHAAPRSIRLPDHARAAGDGVFNITLDQDVDQATASRLAYLIEAAAGQSIAMTIDSDGGDVEAAFAIVAALDRHDCAVHTRIVRAFSSACLIALAGDRRTIQPDGQVMIHQPSLHAANLDASGLRAQADRLDAMAHEIAKHVAVRTGRELDIVQELVDGEVYLTAGQALVLGFATDLADDVSPALPRPIRARTAAIAGPYRPVVPHAMQRAPLLELGRIYQRGDVVRFGASSWQAKGRAIGAMGSLSPAEDRALWERLP